MAELEKLTIVIEANDKEAVGRIDEVISKLKDLDSKIKGSGKDNPFKNIDMSKFAKELEKAQSSLVSVKASLESIPTKGMENLKSEVKEVTKSTEELSKSIKKTQGGKVGSTKMPTPDTSRVTESAEEVAKSGQAVSSMFDQAVSKTFKLSSSLGFVGKSIQLLGTFLKGVVGTLTKVAHLSAEASKGLLKIGTMPFKPVVAGLTAIGSKIRGIVHQITRMVKMRLYRLIAKNIIGGITTGLTNAYHWAKITGNEFARSMDSLATSSLYLKNSLGAMASPLINVLAPAIDFAIDKLVALLNMINQVIARLTGRSTWIKAVKVPTAFADATDNATGSVKALEKELITILGIDEINPLEGMDDSPSGSGGGGGSGATAGSMFTEESITSEAEDWVKMIKDAWAKADFTEIGSIIGTKINTALENIKWDKIKKTAEKIGSSIATLLNGIMETPNLFTNIGKTLAEGLNTGFEFAYGFVVKFHWDSFGKAVTDGINGFMGNLDWNKIKATVKTTAEGIGTAFKNAISNLKWTGKGSVASTIANGINTAVSGLWTLIKNINWSETGSAIASSINDAVRNIDWKKLGRMINDGIQGALDFLTTLINEIDWTAIGEAVRTALAEIDWADIIQKVIKASWDLAGGLSGILRGIIYGVTGNTGVERGREYLNTSTTQYTYRPMDEFGNYTDIEPVEIPAVGVIQSGKAGKYYQLTPLDSSGVIKKAIDERKKKDRIIPSPWSILKNPLNIPKSIASLWQLTKGKNPLNIPKSLSTLWQLTKGKSPLGIPSKITSGWSISSPFNIPLYLASKWKNSGLLGFPSQISSNWWNNGLLNFPAQILSKWQNNGLMSFPAQILSKWQYSGGLNFPSTISSQWQYNGLLNFPASILSQWKNNGLTGFPTEVTSNWKYGGGNDFPASISSIWKYSGGNNFPDKIKSIWKYSGGNNFPDKIKSIWKYSGRNNFPSSIGADWSINNAYLNGKKVNSRLVTGQAKGGAFYGGEWHNIPQYATGGMPAHGSMFIAGESGSELVGHVGGRTEVLNQSQLASTMYASVTSANASQNRLLQEQNNLLRELISAQGNSRTYISSGDIVDALSQRNRRDGRTVVPIGV